MLLPNWNRLRLGDAASPSTMRTVPTKDDKRLFMGLEHVESGSSKVTGWKPASEMRSASARFSAGDVLYGRLRPYLNKVCSPAFDGLASGEFIVLKPGEQVEPPFLLYRMLSADFVALAMQQSDGDRPRAKWKQLAEFPILLPSRYDQRRIVEVIEEQFSRLDAAEASLERALRSLKRLRVASIAAALAGDWPEVEFATIIKSLRNGLFASRPAKNPPGIPIFRISAVRPMQLDVEDVRYAVLPAQEAEGYFVAPGD